MGSSNQEHEYAQLGLQETKELAKMLYYQAEAVWPQERDIILKYNFHCGNSEKLPNPLQFSNAAINILDVGCGSGEIVFRLHSLFPNAISIWGVDLEERNINFAKKKLAEMDEDSQKIIHFLPANAYKLSETPFVMPSSDVAIKFDLILCRSTLHAVKEPETIIKQLLRLVRPGGYVHMLNEDYGMVFYSGVKDVKKVDRLWKEGTCQYFINTGSDPHIGRNSYSIMRKIQDQIVQEDKIDLIKSININYIYADTIHANREDIATILETWRDGYSKEVAEKTDLSEKEIKEAFEDIIETARSPNGFVCWQSVVCTVQKRD